MSGDTVLTTERQPDPAKWAAAWAEPERVPATVVEWRTWVGQLENEDHHIETDRAAYALLVEYVKADPLHPLAEQALAVIGERDDNAERWWYA